MSVLVTGGAGFIGSNLIDRLARQGREVVGLDNFNDYYDPRIKRANAARLETLGATVAEGDFCDLERTEALFRERKLDMVVHLGARAGVRPSLEQPLLYEKVNCQGTLNLLELARRHGVPKFVFASSSSVYGNNTKVPFSEDDPVGRPISPYAATKRAGELLCHTYYHLYGIETVCLRFFTVYGPWGRPDMAIYKFTDAIENGRPIAMYGDGTTQRDYTFIEDILDGVTAAMERTLGYEIVNLGESKVIELRRLIETIEDALGKKAQIERRPMQPGDVEKTYADIAKARRLLDYNPQYPVSKGVPAFVEWYREMRSRLR